MAEQSYVKTAVSMVHVNRKKTLTREFLEIPQRPSPESIG